MFFKHALVKSILRKPEVTVCDASSYIFYSIPRYIDKIYEYSNTINLF